MKKTSTKNLTDKFDEKKQAFCFLTPGVASYLSDQFVNHNIRDEKKFPTVIEQIADVLQTKLGLHILKNNAMELPYTHKRLEETNNTVVISTASTIESLMSYQGPEVDLYEKNFIIIASALEKELKSDFYSIAVVRNNKEVSTGIDIIHHYRT